MPMSSPQMTRMLGLVDFAIAISFQTIQLGRRASRLRCVAISSAFLRERKTRSGWNDVAFISMLRFARCGDRIRTGWRIGLSIVFSIRTPTGTAYRK